MGIQENLFKHEGETSIEQLLTTVEKIESSLSQLFNDIQKEVPLEKQQPSPQPPTVDQHAHFRRKMIPTSNNPPQNVNFKQQLSQWSNDRVKANEILQKHSEWLSNFKQQLQQPLLASYAPQEPQTVQQHSFSADVIVPPIQVPLVGRTESSKPKQVAIYIS
jgi:hypothetical protein